MRMPLVNRLHMPLIRIYCISHEVIKSHILETNVGQASHVPGMIAHSSRHERDIIKFHLLHFRTELKIFRNLSSHLLQIICLIHCQSILCLMAYQLKTSYAMLQILSFDCFKVDGIGALIQRTIDSLVVRALFKTL